MPEDDPKIPPFATPRIVELTLSDEQNTFFREQGGRELGEAVNRLGLQDPSRALGERLARQCQPDIQIAREQLEQAEMEIAQLDLKIAELKRERAGRREAAHALQAWLFERELGTPAPTAPPTTPPPPAAAVAARTQAPVTRTLEDDDFQEGLVRRFLDDHPNLVGKSAARIRKAMGGLDGSPAPAPGSWTVNEAERLDRPKLTVPSLTTIRRQLHERRLRSPLSA